MCTTGSNWCRLINELRKTRIDRSAVCGGHEMRRGVHYATFTLRSMFPISGVVSMGVVGAGFDPTGSGRAFESPQGWVLDTAQGYLHHNGRGGGWEGHPNRLKMGDVVVRLPFLCTG